VKVRWRKRGISLQWVFVAIDGYGRRLDWLFKESLCCEVRATTPPDNRTYNMYQKIVFQNGVEYLWEAPVDQVCILHFHLV
jgi:hypothetical protein